MLVDDDKKNTTEEDTTEDSSDTDTDDTEDTTEPSDDSSEDDTEDTEDSEEVTAEDKRKAAETFLDPKSVPDELKPAFKRMQASFTRKMQAASGVLKQAEAFEQLVADPAFRSWIETRKSGKPTSKVSEDEDDTDDEDKPLTKRELKNLLAQEKVQEEHKQQEVMLRAEAKAFKENHPNWDIHKDEMDAVLSKNPTLSYEQAYILATQDDRVLLSKKDSIESKKKANMRKPSAVQGKESEKKGKMTIHDAYELAAKKLGIK